MHPCSLDPEMLRRRSPTEMDSGSDTSGVMFDGMPQTSSRFEFDMGSPLWEDILGIVLRFLPCLADRARVRSVCRHWRSAAGNHTLPPPLPLLVLPQFNFSSLSSTGELMPVRRVPMPKEVGADDLRCVGSFDGWLVGVTPSKDRSREYYRHADGECFLVNAFTRKVVRLLQLCTSQFNVSDYASKILPIINDPGDVVHFLTNGTYRLSVRKMVLSSSPDSGSKYIVAAYSDNGDEEQLALWRPGMTSWHVCNFFYTDMAKDLAFYQGKLYVILRAMPHLFAFELEEDDCEIAVSRVEHCVTQPLCSDPMELGSCNIVVWREVLLLIVRYYDCCLLRRNVLKVKVFALDFSTNPYGLTEVHSFDGDCIFVGSGGCKSYPARQHDIVEGDLIYFVPDAWSPYDRFVYNMRDGTMRPFAVELLPCNEPEEIPDHPVWLFPSE